MALKASDVVQARAIRELYIPILECVKSGDLIDDDSVNRRQFVQSLLAAANLPLATLRSQSSPPVQGDAGAPGTSSPVLWYSRGASRWVEALPIGNGRLGAMVFGDVSRERLQLNDDTLWSGGPGTWDTPGAREVLPELRRLTLAGRLRRRRSRGQADDGAVYPVLPAARRSLAHVRARQHRTGLPARAAPSRRRRVGALPRRRRPLHAGGDRQPSGRHHRGAAHRRSSGHAHVRRAALERAQARVAAEDGMLRVRGVAPAHVDPSYYQTDVPVQYGREGGRARRALGSRGNAAAEARAAGRCRGCGSSSRSAPSPTAGRHRPGPAGCASKAADAVTLVVSAATAFNGFDQDPALHGRDPGPIVDGGRSQRRSRRRGPRCATRTSPIIEPCSTALSLELPADARGQSADRSAHRRTRRAPTPGSSSCSSSTAATC